MSRIKQFKLPDLGEGLTDGEIIKWLVAPGDEVTLNQPIVEVETAKAAVEVPSPYAGVVTVVHHAEGDTVDVGTPIIEFDTDPGAGPIPVGPPSGADDLSAGAAAGARARAMADTEIGRPGPDEPVEPGLIGGPAPGGRTSVLVGYGPKTVSATRRPRRAAAGQPPAPAAVPAVEPPAPASGGAVAPAGPAAVVLAKPPVRKFARDLGVDLRTVTGTGPGGTITRADVEALAAVSEANHNGSAAPAAPRWDAGREQRIPIRGVRRHTAAAVSASAFTAPHVTEFLTLDITETMLLRERVARMPEFDGVRVTPLAFVARALLLAVRRNPMINSSWDESAQEIVVKEYVNLGIAASTPRGLIVPNVKDAGRLGLRELAVALGELTETARAGRTTPADMQNGSITITNVGVFGVDTGTPILTPGESAILAFGAVRERPWVHEHEIAIRQVTQLALSFDHRVVDGDLGSCFLRDVGAVLADPTLAAIWG
ncbi:MAG TPA: dihydrolipoamide acetyltransferase family protein [Mycobacteriales bacterium]|nr:dihydrolipoamide acetyltransferase family protein [Mycobacteriales bacterium]